MLTSAPKPAITRVTKAKPYLNNDQEEGQSSDKVYSEVRTLCHGRLTDWEFGRQIIAVFLPDR